MELEGEGLRVHIVGVERPALLVLPSGHDLEIPLPLVISLHGYGFHYQSQDSYFGLSALVDSHNFALLPPNGVKDDRGKRFWNATDYCCGLIDSKPDDFAHLRGLVEEAGAHVKVDRLFAVGFSNGAYMSYRLTCDSFPGLAGIAILGGASYSDPSRCASARPVSVLHIQGTGDEGNRVEGGSNSYIGEGSYPGAHEMIRR